MKAYALLVLVLAATTSCKSFENLMSDPGREAFVEGNRFSGGPTINELHGPATKTMLESHGEIEDALSALQVDYKERVAERDDFARELQDLKREFDLKTNMVVAAESETRRLRVDKRDLEAKTLSLSIENARQRKELLSFRIAGLNRQLGSLDGGQSNGIVNANASPPGR